MRQPQRSKSQKRQVVAQTATLPAPIGGWNTKDTLARMSPTDAVALDNFFPQTSFCTLRPGSALHQRIAGGHGRTMLVYNGLTGVNKLFVSTATAIYNVTSSIGTPSAESVTITNGAFQHTMFGDGTNNWLILVNGVDAPRYYDGTNWVQITGASSPALSGVTLTDLINVNVYKGRLFFIENNSLEFWYLAAGAAGGALTSFTLAGEAKKGGYIMAMSSWTRDAGDGQDDVAVFVTSEGEAIIYQGNNPASAAAWAKVGTFFVGKPLGRRCMTQYGADLLILTESGLFEMSSALKTAQVDSRFSISYKIHPSFTLAAQIAGDVAGWQSVVFQAENALIVNIPVVAGGEHHQYVMNTISRAWCRFTYWNAESFAVFNLGLYFCCDHGDDTLILHAWDGTTDYPHVVDVELDVVSLEPIQMPIVGYGKQAFNYLNQMEKVKQVKMMRPILGVNGEGSYGLDVDVDFQDRPMFGLLEYTSSKALWDEATWDVSQWDEANDILRTWKSIGSTPGVAIAPKLQVTSGTASIDWIAMGLLYETGSIM